MPPTRANLAFTASGTSPPRSGTAGAFQNRGCSGTLPFWNRSAFQNRFDCSGTQNCSGTRRCSGTRPVPEHLLLFQNTSLLQNTGGSGTVSRSRTPKPVPEPLAHAATPWNTPRSGTPHVPDEPLVSQNTALSHERQRVGSTSRTETCPGTVVYVS